MTKDYILLLSKMMPKAHIVRGPQLPKPWKVAGHAGEAIASYI